MRTLSIDIETYSNADLKKSGVYKYTEASGFEILMIAYRYDTGPVTVLDLYNPNTNIDEFIEGLLDPTVLKKAWNANFERTCLAKFFDRPMPPEQWECAMVKAAMLGLPQSLSGAAAALKLEQQKDVRGKTLIRYFCMFCKPTKTNKERTRNLPSDAPDMWDEFLAYVKQDVETECAVSDAIAFYTIPPHEKLLWNLDQQINDRGIAIDIPFVENAMAIDAAYRNELISEAIILTGKDNPNSLAQLREWLEVEMEFKLSEKMTKKDIPGLIASTTNETIKRVLAIRQEISKTSIKKYAAMLNAVCADGRARGLLQFCGAGRTWRWAGRLIQMQNLPKNSLKDLDLARQIVAAGEGAALEMLYGNVSDTLSQLIRTAFIPTPGNRFLVSDFSAIEAVVIAWLAGEKWRLDVFNGDGKIYEWSASKMFGVLMESIGKDSPLRQKGKVAELALGFQGGINALIAMGILLDKTIMAEVAAARARIVVALNGAFAPEDDIDKAAQKIVLQPIVDAWRAANRKIVQLWYDVQARAFEAMQRPGLIIHLRYGIAFQVRKGILFIKLPSGRELAYMRVAFEEGKNGMVITYQGQNQTTKQWGKQYIYGGKFVENIVQAIARDCLANAMTRLDAADYEICCHVHDEVIIEAPESFGNLKDVNSILATPISWAPGLPLRAEGFTGYYYKK